AVAAARGFRRGICRAEPADRYRADPEHHSAASAGAAGRCRARRTEARRGQCPAVVFAHGVQLLCTGVLDLLGRARPWLAGTAGEAARQAGHGKPGPQAAGADVGIADYPGLGRLAALAPAPAAHAATAYHGLERGRYL